MREIKFRGLLEGSKEWACGSVVLNNGLMSLMIPTGLTYFSSPLMMNAGKWVYTETISQYTGLKDKNGFEIYEGDILKGWKESHWHDGKDRVFQSVEWNCNVCGFNISGFDCDEIEVIGNIYEHPHLLKGE